MSTSCQMPWWFAKLTKFTPFLFRCCLGCNLHWRWDRVCYCVNGENGHGIMFRIKKDRWVDIGGVDYAIPKGAVRRHFKRINP